MREDDRLEFAKVIHGMQLIYGGQTLGVTAVELYFSVMTDWSIEDFKAAAARLLKTCKFMPRPSDFEDLKKAGKETAGEVFGRIREYLYYSPAGYTTKAGTPQNIAAAMAACGGANAIAMSTVEGLPFLEKRFCQHYDQISGANDTRMALPGLSAEMIGFDDEDASED